MKVHLGICDVVMYCYKDAVTVPKLRKMAMLFDLGI